MIATGSGLVAFGVLVELFGGTFFRHFLDWRWLRGERFAGSEWVKTAVSRTCLLGGLLLMAIGAISALA